MAYFCQWVVDSSMFNGDYGMAQTLLAVLGAIPMAAAAVVVVPLANKFGKRTVVFFGMVVGVIGGIIAGLGGSNITAVGIGVALKCLGSAPAAYLILAMLADVIDHIEFKSGIRTDGLTMSIYSALMVAGTPVMNAAFMSLLGFSGYIAPDATGVVASQAENVQAMISISYIWIETVAYGIAAILVIFWAVEKKLSEEQAVMVSRKQGS